MLLGLAVRHREKTPRSVMQWIKNLLRLRRDIDLVGLHGLRDRQIGEMRDTLAGTRSSLLGAIRSALQDGEWRQIEAALDAYFDASLDLSALGGNQKHQLCLFIRTGLSGALDVSRSLYLPGGERHAARHLAVPGRALALPRRLTRSPVRGEARVLRGAGLLHAGGQQVQDAAAGVGITARRKP